MSHSKGQTTTKNTHSNLNKEFSLSTQKRKNLLAGVSVTEDPLNSERLDEFSEELYKTKEATDLGQAWVTAIIPPEEDNDEQPPDTTDEISVEFMLKNGITFWESYSIKNSYIPEDHNFMKLLNYTGNTIFTISNLLGESIPVKYKESEKTWRVATEELNTEEQEDTQKLTANDPLGLMIQVYVIGFVMSFLFFTFDISQALEMTWIYGTPAILLMIGILFLSNLYEPK